MILSENVKHSRTGAGFLVRTLCTSGSAGKPRARQSFRFAQKKKKKKSATIWPEKKNAPGPNRPQNDSQTSRQAREPYYFISRRKTDRERGEWKKKRKVSSDNPNTQFTYIYKNIGDLSRYSRCPATRSSVANNSVSSPGDLSLILCAFFLYSIRRRRPGYCLATSAESVLTVGRINDSFSHIAFSDTRVFIYTHIYIKVSV